MGSFAKPKVSAREGQTLSSPEHAALKKLDEFIDAMNLVIEGNAVANDPMLMDDVTRSVSRLSRTVLVAAACRMMNLKLDPISEDDALRSQIAQPITLDVTTTRQ